MPSTSERQRKAMRAAAAGNSTIGIPKKVGQEFVRADKTISHPNPHTPVHRQKHRDIYGTRLKDA